MSAYLEPELTYHNRLQRVSLGLVAIIIVTAILVICGWQWDVPLLRQFGSGLPAMNPLTALSFLLSSFSFLILASSFRSRPLDILGYLLAGVVLVFAATRLAGYFIPDLEGVDQFLFTDRLGRDLVRGFHGRMTFNTTLCFVCWTLAILLLRRAGRVGSVIQPMALVIAALGLLSVMGYVYRVRVFHGILQYFPMAANTTGCFILSALALLLATPDRGFMKDLT